jgi:hypothetical protein
MANVSIGPSTPSGGFSTDDLERIWRLDSPPQQSPLRTLLLIRRASPNDIGSGSLAVTIDDWPAQTELQYGDSVTMTIAPGAHVVKIRNGWAAGQLATHVDRGCALIVECGVGLQSGFWSALLPRRLRALNLWIALRPA